MAGEARNEYRMVLAIMPFPASPMDTYTGLLRPGTVTLRTRIEYAGEVAGQAVRPWSSRQCLEMASVIIGSVFNPESTWTPFSGGGGVGGITGQ
jgi:hypothetical protein